MKPSLQWITLLLLIIGLSYPIEYTASQHIITDSISPDKTAFDISFAQSKPFIHISLAQPNFATMVNDKHSGNRIGYRFHEHSPISYGKVPFSDKVANINAEKTKALEENFKNAANVFVYKHEIKEDSIWVKQDWTFYLKPVQDGIEILLVVNTYDEGLPAYYGVQQCFRMSGRTNREWRKKIANTPAFSEYDLWDSQSPDAEKKSLTYVLRNHEWQTIPADEKATGARTPLGIEIDNLRTEGQPMAEVGPYRATMLKPIDNGLITRVNLSRTWVCGIYWQNTSHVTDHHPADCLHSIINIGNVPPSAKKTMLGKIYWFEGNLNDLYDHYMKDFSE
jgi:hypothetical protein